MTDIRVYSLGVPRIPRNKRIYAEGTSKQSITVSGGAVPLVHIEASVLKADAGDILSKSINIVFNSKFVDRPVGWIDVYRMQLEGSIWMKADVLISYSVSEPITINGFSFDILAHEELLSTGPDNTGVIIEYNFTERTI